MEVDTGASLSVISEGTYKHLVSQNGAPPLEKSGIVLRTYTGEEVKPEGVCTVDVHYEGGEYSLPLLVGENEQDLERLEKAGTIEPVQYSEWATPIVPVMKSDGTVRVCGDYKLTVNKVSKLDGYPIPKLDDLYTKLAGGQTFTELDLSHAYEQMLVDENSREFLTINTHKGLFRYNRLPYGVSSAPGIFQRTMEGLLQGIPSTGVLLDNILITGPSTEEHLDNIEKVLGRLSEARFGVPRRHETCR
ncbi:hypothetical protein ACROYT_G017529 [Oculina patagonica]